MSPTYRSWDRMIQRCTNPNHAGFANYGGRGITMYEGWYDFAIFLADMGERPSPRHSIERTNNDLGYSKANCVWATKLTQINNRRTTLFVEYDGERMPFAEACRRSGVGYNTAYNRKVKGLPESEWFA